MSTMADLHNKLAGKIVADIVKPVIEAGGTSSDYLVLLESVVVGVMLTMPPGADGKDGDLARCLILCRAAAHRCAEIRAAKAKEMH